MLGLKTAKRNTLRPSVEVQTDPTADVLSEIPRPAGEDAGLRDDAKPTKSLRFQTAPLSNLQMPLQRKKANE
jgi:hypothetical protein